MGHMMWLIVAVAVLSVWTVGAVVVGVKMGHAIRRADERSEMERDGTYLELMWFESKAENALLTRT
ncbi:hypothetical protein [Rhodococcoides corynebacterioides]|uniref:Uncharacterized protein n=1 Tax=Rhodococcoides corynebacterioides TaxID=53972 RepID=A0ABS7P833_9NOCA|nr:hypothetical protein [Rhodococcus corynebacterioides]MBY6368596.1 hypothetical protein [Rhodococcus corynebacterioides]MBY6409896.1 hypothetical protein [Rhodococcus corynebacterioides]